MSTPTSRTSKQAAVAQVAFAAALWGSWGWFLRKSGLPPITCAAISFAGNALFAVPLIRLDAVTPKYSKRVWWILAVSVVLELINVGSFFAALQMTRIPIAVLAHYLAPVLVALLAPYIVGERLRGAIPSALVALVGLAIVMEPWNGSMTQTDMVGASLAALSAIGYAGNVFTARVLTPEIGAARAHMIKSAIAAAIVCPALTHALDNGASGLGYVVCGAAIPGALASWLFIKGMSRVGAATASVLAYCEPISAVLISYAFLDEKLTAGVLLGGVLIIASGVWVASARLTMQSIPPPP